MESFYHRFRRVLEQVLHHNNFKRRKFEEAFGLSLSELYENLLPKAESAQELAVVAFCYLCVDEGKLNRNRVGASAVLQFLAEVAVNGPSDDNAKKASIDALSKADCTESGIRRWIEQWYRF